MLSQRRSLGYRIVPPLSPWRLGGRCHQFQGGARRAYGEWILLLNATSGFDISTLRAKPVAPRNNATTEAERIKNAGPVVRQTVSGRIRV